MKSRWNKSLAHALRWASKNGNTNSVIRILQTEVEPTSKTVHRQSALSIAAELGHTGVVEVFLTDARVDGNGKVKDNKLPLSVAAANRFSEIVGLLLRHENIEVNMADIRGTTPLIWAVVGSYFTEWEIMQSRAVPFSFMKDLA